MAGGSLQCRPGDQYITHVPPYPYARSCTKSLTTAWMAWTRCVADDGEGSTRLQPGGLTPCWLLCSSSPLS